MSWRTTSSGFLCSFHAWFENIPERERGESGRGREWQGERTAERGRGRESERQRDTERHRENAATKLFFPW